MADQLYRPIVRSYIVGETYPWRRPGEPEITALIRYGIGFLLDTPPNYLPQAVHAYAVDQLTDWARENPAPEFSKNFERE